MRTWITWLRWRLAQALGRNPLVRTTDRIETLVLAVAVVLSLAAIPVSAATAVVVHDKRVRTYAAEAQARRPVVANIIGTKAKDTHLRAAAVQNRWPLGGGPQAEPLRGPAPTSIGDHRQTWLNRHGEHVAPPSPSWRAGVDAWAAGAVTWLLATAVAATLFALARSWLNRVRRAAWERDIRSLADDGGRANRQT